jgi:adenylosuccinate lyase
MCGLARLLRGNALAGMENIELWHERDISHSSVERVILPDSSVIAHYMTAKFEQIVRSLDIRPERMLENMQSSRGLAFSGTVLTRLVEKGLSRDEAYDRVQSAAMEARRTGEAFREALGRDERVVEILGEKELEDAFSLERHLAHAEEVFRRLCLLEEEPEEKFREHARENAS